MKNVNVKSDMALPKQNSVVSKFKVAMISATVTSLICTSLPNSYASDIEIYKVPEDSVGTTTLVFMLDVSGSMDNKDSQPYSRIDRLKIGMRDVLYGTPNTDPLADKIYIGLASFDGRNGRIREIAKSLGENVSGETYVPKKEIYYSYRVGSNTRFKTCEDWHSTTLACKKWGTTILNSKPSGSVESSSYKCSLDNTCVMYYKNQAARTKTHRDKLVEISDGLTGGSTTPTPYAYAEAAAYLMGQYPLYNTEYYFVRDSDKKYKKCSSSYKSGECSNWGSWINQAISTTELANYKKGSFGKQNSYDGYYYLAPSNYSGFTSSVNTSKDGLLYKAPASILAQIGDTESARSKRECSGQGIYFLTDGKPEPDGIALGYDNKSGTSYELMKSALGDSGAYFDCNNNILGQGTGYDPEADWKCIGNFATSLLSKEKNPINLQIKTAVVGFGASFSDSVTGSSDVEDAKLWGLLGGGGWYSSSSPQDIVTSVNKFIDELNKDIPSMSTGSSTIPLDALNPAVVQPYAYFPQFEPKVKPEDTQQIWFGNLKKYYVVNNGVYSSKTIATDDTVVVKKSKLQDLDDIWNKGETYPDGTALFKKGGVLNHLPLGTMTTDGKIQTGRKLFTDYAYDGTKSVENGRIKKDLDLTQIKYTYTLDATTKTDTTYARALMGLLGYVISSDKETNGLDLSKETASLRQMGSIYHSKPLLLTQSGKAEAARVDGKVVIDTNKRDDYVLFGTTQGLVQVVDAVSGIEKFAFVPKEIIENQSETFKQGGGNLAAGKNALYYGMDGEWVAHTAYVSKSDGSLTVEGTTRDILGSDNNQVEELKGKQWVYGGMRMGGRSYYALDLTDIDKPKIKFHIDPATGKVYSQDKPSGTEYTALKMMGQSWSKPSLGYVNWKGQRKLVMIVGGGYDAGGDDGDGLKTNGIRTGYAGYETYDYKQTNRIGAGVYMFDADTGELLWNIDSANNASLKYSIVSQIRTVDRNNDGIIDHLYYGDLAGQAFRTDFKNDGNQVGFTTQTTQILNLQQKDNTNKNLGTSPRFYTLPAFTAHHSAGSSSIYGGNTVVVTFLSGNQSAPLLATSDSPQKKDSINLQFDGAYAIFDYDVYPSTAAGRYPLSNIAARTLATTTSTTAVTSQLRYVNDAITATTIDKNSGWGGWYYQFNKKIDGTTSKTASVIKGLTTPIALEGSLYVTQFDASDNGTTSSCGAGVKGHSFTQRLCLPGGVCKDGKKYIYNLGSGIVTLNVGSVDGDPNKRSLVVPDPNDICPAGQICTPKNEEKFLKTGGSLRFIPNRWYEKYAQ